MIQSDAVAKLTAAATVLTNNSTNGRNRKLSDIEKAAGLAAAADIVAASAWAAARWVCPEDRSTPIAVQPPVGHAVRTETAEYVVYDTSQTSLVVRKLPTPTYIKVYLTNGHPDRRTWQQLDTQIRADCVRAGLTVSG